MLDRVYVRSHSSFGQQPLDVGALGEACLFYGSTELVLGRGSLGQLLDRYGADALVEFVTKGYVRAHMLEMNVGVMTEDNNGPTERHRPVAFTFADSSLEAQVVAAFRKATGKSGLGRRRARAFLEAVTPISLGDSWHDNLLAAFRDQGLMQSAITSTAKHSLGPTSGVAVIAHEIAETSDGCFSLRLSDNWSELRHRYAVQRGEELNSGHLLTYLVEALTDLQLASRLQGEISTSELGAELLQIKCRELEMAASANAQNVANFQSHVLRGRDIRSAINSGDRDLDDLMRLLDRARMFRNWIDERPIETDLVAAYLDEVTAGTWATTLPAKTVRLAVLLALGALVAGPAGLVVGGALSAADTFLLERLVAGWRPNQFVERSLDPFAGG